MKTKFTHSLRLLTMAGAVLALGACTNMNDTQSRALSGGAIGAGVGTAATVVTGGCVACGAAVGGVVGAGSGLVYDQIEKNKGR